MARIAVHFTASDHVGLYKEMKSTFAAEYSGRLPVYKQRLAQWNSDAPIVRLEKPTNIARARELGYKAKQGVVVARVRIRGGASKRPAFSGGRKPSKSGRYFFRAKSMQAISEERAARRFTNCEVLNSYFAGASGSNLFYEILLIERGNPSVASDPLYSQVLSQRNRVFRGLTRSGRKHRGVAIKGFGTIHNNRPSVRSNVRN